MRLHPLALTCAGLIAALLIGGCAPMRQEEDFASRLISEKAAIASAAQRDYAALLAEDYSTVQKRQAAFETDTIDVDYIGDPKELVQTIAARYGMAYAETGRISDLRPINIRMKAVSPDSVLHNIGNQMDAAANVILNLPAKTVTIEYKAMNQDNDKKKGS